MMSRQEFMNTGSKSHLQLLFLDNGPRIKNRQRGFTRLGLVYWWPESSSDTACSNVLRAKHINQVKAGPSTKYDNKAGIKADNKANKVEDNKTNTRKHKKAGTERGDNKTSIGGVDKAGTRK